MSDIAEKWANTPDPPRPKAQQRALDELDEIKFRRMQLAYRAQKLDDLELEAARRAWKAGVPRSVIANHLDRTLQTIHNWVNPDEPPKKGRRYGQPTDEQLREAGIDV